MPYTLMKRDRGLDRAPRNSSHQPIPASSFFFAFICIAIRWRKVRSTASITRRFGTGKERRILVSFSREEYWSERLGI